MIWAAAAIAPRSWPTWALENLPVVAVVIVLVTTHRRFAFSDFSYLLIAIFLTLHAIGAHTGYAFSPLGHWLATEFDLRRNYYDRVVHFSFGLLLAHPFRELLVAHAGVSRRTGGWLSVSLVLAASAAFEVVEAFIAETVSPGTGPDWLGAQGDEWDAQLDMLVALLGALLALLLAWRSGGKTSPIQAGARS